MVLTNDGKELNMDDVWHVRLPTEVDVKTMRITDLTPLTVQMMEMPYSMVQLRYEISRCAFLDKVS